VFATILVCLATIWLVFFRPTPFSGAGLVVVHIDAVYFYPDDGSKGERWRLPRSATYKGQRTAEDGWPDLPLQEFGDVFWTAARADFAGRIEWDLRGRKFVVEDLRSVGPAKPDDVIAVQNRVYGQH